MSFFVIRDSKKYISVRNIEFVKHDVERDSYEFSCEKLEDIVSLMAKGLAIPYGDALRYIIKLLSSSSDIACIRVPSNVFCDLHDSLMDGQRSSDPNYSNEGYVNLIIYSVPIISADLPEHEYIIYYKSNGVNAKTLKMGIKKCSSV